MHAFGTAYYHFAGSRDAHPGLRASNLMLLESALWARGAGFTRYHLGGGVTRSAGDSLLRFKAGFSDRRAPLYTYFCVRDAPVYERLCERKRAYERATEGRESASDFLPLYRR
jgi:lipid II:glycine glycyltransferase (peptidoglycan interpeptide bridge formation enzyme)